MKHYIFSTLLVTIACLRAGAVEIIHGPYLQNMEKDRVTIVWVTDQPTVGWVETAPYDGSVFYEIPRPRYFDAPTGVKETARIHSVTLTGLTPGTTYRYRVYAREVLEHKGNYVTYGHTKATSPYQVLTFRTPDPSGEKVNFAMVNDIHGDNEKLTDLIGQCDASMTDFFIFNGDMVSVSETEEQVFSGFMDKSVELFATAVPMYYARGNHETRGAMATHFKEYFSPGCDHIYYTFRQGPVFFIMLDGGEDKPDTDIEYYDITDYDTYRSDEAAWLSEVVNSEEYRNAPYKVVVCHMPPDKGWYGSCQVLEKFVPILNGARPDIMLCGHYHSHDIRKAGTAVKFPVIINDNKSVIKATADATGLRFSIVGRDGKETAHFEIKK